MDDGPNGYCTTRAARAINFPDHGWWWVVSRQCVEESFGPILRAAAERNPDHHEILPDEDDPTILDAYHTYRLRDL